MSTLELTVDPVINAVLTKFVERHERGMKVYGQTMADNPLPFSAWLNHAQEEAMDFVNYLERSRASFELVEKALHQMADENNRLEQEVAELKVELGRSQRAFENAMRLHQDYVKMKENG